MGSRSIETPVDDAAWEQRVAGFRHLNVVALTASGNWYVMDRKLGCSLAELQRTGVGVDARQSLRVLLDALIGMDAIHRYAAQHHPAGYVHGELCPASIMAGRDGIGRVVPVPTRRLVGAALHDASGYLAPEKLLGDHLDARADVFSIGVLLWEAIAGRRLFPDGRVDAVVTQLVGGKVPALLCSPQAAWATVLEPLVARALAVDPAQRWPHVGVMVAQMENLARGQLAPQLQIAELVTLELERSPGRYSSGAPPRGSSSLTPTAASSPVETPSATGAPALHSARPNYPRRDPPPPGQIAWEHAGSSSRPPRPMISRASQSARQARLVAMAIAFSVVVAGASAYVLIFADNGQPSAPATPSILVTQASAASAPVLELAPAPAESAAEKRAPGSPSAATGPLAPPAAPPRSPPVNPTPPRLQPVNPSPSPALRPAAPAPTPATLPRPVKPKVDPKEQFGI